MRPISSSFEQHIRTPKGDPHAFKTPVGTSAPAGRLRVLVISHTYVEPTNREKWVALREIAPEWDVTVVTPKAWRDPQFGITVSIREESDRLRFLPLQTLGRSAGRYFFISFRLVELLLREKPDLIYVEAEPWSAVYLQTAALRRLLVPAARLAVFSWWNTPMWTTPLHFPGSECYRAGLRATDLLIAGNHGAAELHRAHGFSRRIEIIPQLGVDPLTHAPGARDPELSRRYELENEFVIGFVGRLQERKCAADLLDAAAKLNGDHSKVLFVGEGPDRQRLVNHATALGIADRVVFAGAVPREEIPRYMKLMDALVLPSGEQQWEQFGHVLIEAMACGVPVLGSTSGEIPWVIGDERLIFPIGDSDALCSRLRQLRNQPDFVAECRARGLERVENMYSNSAVARQLRAAYEQVVRESEN